jgi:hypothetical protein
MTSRILFIVADSATWLFVARGLQGVASGPFVLSGIGIVALAATAALLVRIRPHLCMA